MRFNLVHVIPDARLHGLNGYAEVMETMRWGLIELGNPVAVSTNRVDTDADVVNILFGVQMCSVAEVESLPANTIVYNLEQLANIEITQLRPSYHAAARRLRMWDYSERNIAAMNALGPAKPIVHVPIGWSPTISRIPKPVEQDIDVLFYGMPGVERLTVIGQIAQRWLKTVYVCGLYGAARDLLIARSKIILNINLYQQQHVFELVRVSYLLANGKAVVSDVYDDSAIEPDLRGAVALHPLEKIADACAGLIEDDTARRVFENAGPALMKRQDIRPILQQAIRASGLSD